MNSYADYLNHLSLDGLRKEAHEFKATKTNKGIGRLILALTVSKLKQSTSTKTPIDFSFKYETERYQSASQDYSSRMII